MPNAYQWLGAAGAGQAGVQGAQALADLIAKQNQQEAAAAELDIRRQHLAGEAEQRQFTREYQQGMLDYHNLATRLAAAGEAAKYGSFGGLADVTNLPAESFSHYEAPPNNLEEALARLTARGKAFTPGGEAPFVEPGLPTAQLKTEMTPEASNIVRMISELNKSKIRPLTAPSPEDEYIRYLTDLEGRNELLPFQAEQLNTWREQATGMKAKPGTLKPPSQTSGSPSALVRHYLEKKELQGSLSQDDEIALQAALSNLRAPAGQAAAAGTRAGEEPPRTKQQEWKAWNDDFRATVARVNDNVAKSYGANKDTAISNGIAELNHLVTRAPDPESKKAAEAFTKRWVAGQKVKPLVPGQRRLGGGG